MSCEGTCVRPKNFCLATLLSFFGIFCRLIQTFFNFDLYFYTSPIPLIEMKTIMQILDPILIKIKKKHSEKWYQKFEVSLAKGPLDDSG